MEQRNEERDKALAKQLIEQRMYALIATRVAMAIDALVMMLVGYFCNSITQVALVAGIYVLVLVWKISRFTDSAKHYKERIDNNDYE